MFSKVTDKLQPFKNCVVFFFDWTIQIIF